MPKARKQSEAERQLKELRYIGGKMAGLCFNLAQRVGKEPVSERDAAVMRDFYREWDKAVLSIPVKKPKAKATHA